MIAGANFIYVNIIIGIINPFITLIGLNNIWISL